MEVPKCRDSDLGVVQATAHRTYHYLFPAPILRRSWEPGEAVPGPLGPFASPSGAGRARGRGIPRKDERVASDQTVVATSWALNASLALLSVAAQSAVNAGPSGNLPDVACAHQIVDTA